MKRFVLFLCALACLSACHDNDDDSPSPAQKVSRSVLVYMAAENNLTASQGIRFMRNDLSEIIEGSKLMTDDQRLFVFIDSMNSSNTKNGTPVLLEVHGGETTVAQSYDCEFYSCDPAKFKEVVQWVQTNAPANDYGLVLWGHSCGWVVSNDSIAGSRSVTRAYGQDNGVDGDTYGLKWMNITQMAHALEGLQKLEFIFADCCNMMCAEVGYELRKSTNYLIGSPAEIPGNGAPYDKILPYLYKSSSTMYKGIIDNYYEYYIQEFQKDIELKGYSLPMSVIDTKYISQLAEATHDVLVKFTDGYPMYPLAPNLYGNVFYWYYDTPIMYDMRAFIKHNTSSEDFNEWDQVFKQAVPYHRMSMMWMTIYTYLDYAFKDFTGEESENGCVSMFIPRNNQYYYNSEFNYIKTFNNFGWNRVVDWSRFGWSAESTYVR